MYQKGKRAEERKRMITETLNHYYDDITDKHLYLTHSPGKFFIEIDGETIKTFPYTRLDNWSMRTIGKQAYEHYLMITEIFGKYFS